MNPFRQRITIYGNRDFLDEAFDFLKGLLEDDIIAQCRKSKSGSRIDLIDGTSISFCILNENYKGQKNTLALVHKEDIDFNFCETVIMPTLIPNGQFFTIDDVKDLEWRGNWKRYYGKY